MENWMLLTILFPGLLFLLNKLVKVTIEGQDIETQLFIHKEYHWRGNTTTKVEET